MEDILRKEEKTEQQKKQALYLVLFAVLGAGFRRWFGGGFGKLGDITRFWKYLVLALIVLSMYYVKGLLDWQDWRMYAVIVAFAYHWARSHGDYFYVYDTGKDEGRIWWIDQVLRLLYGEDGYYNFKGNVTGLFLRYTSTACLVALALPNPWFICAGVLTTLSYVVTGKMERPTEKAEWLAGALNFGLLYLCI